MTQWLFDTFLPVKDKHGQVLFEIENFAQETKDLFGIEELKKIQSNDEKLRLHADAEPLWPYDSAVRVFMIDNNKDPLFCSALVYDMPHRVQPSPDGKQKNEGSLWRFVGADHPAKLVATFNSEEIWRSASSFSLRHGPLVDHYQR